LGGLGARFASTDGLKKTLVHAEHVKAGGSLVDFAGILLFHFYTCTFPLTYRESAHARKSEGKRCVDMEYVDGMQRNTREV